ncbi:hypothetical protein CEXT_160951 [Caerostris extrusa]|uniref:Uncharacterized protein n=1 Tax=Caerostris extrusa TaxID=172846 RepID=A0AAV4WB40_CAEEX|nr:hypothetical protein CEXT_160951 [Caerostris extrusa]
MNKISVHPRLSHTSDSAFKVLCSHLSNFIKIIQIPNARKMIHGRSTSPHSRCFVPIFHKFQNIIAEIISIRPILIYFASVRKESASNGKRTSIIQMVLQRGTERAF